MSQTEFLSTEDLKLWQLEDGSLVMKQQCKKTLLSPPRRALPLTNPDEFIVLSDNDGHEIGVLHRVADLEPASQAVLREALAREYVLETITRILEVDREPLTGQTRWRVELASDVPTEGEQPAQVENAHDVAEEHSEDDSDDNGKRGLAKVTSFLTLSRDKERSEHSASGHQREFTINGPEDVQTARYPHIFIVDTERNRYEIPNCEELDLESRRAAERFF
jgi:hypothetical protein